MLVVGCGIGNEIERFIKAKEDWKITGIDPSPQMISQARKNMMWRGATLVILDITGSKSQIKQNLKILKLLLPKGLDEEEINNRLNRIENELYAVSEKRLSELLQEAVLKNHFAFFNHPFIWVG